MGVWVPCFAGCGSAGVGAVLHATWCQNGSRRWCVIVLVMAVPVPTPSNPSGGTPTSPGRTPRLPTETVESGGGKFLHPGATVFPTSIPQRAGCWAGCTAGTPTAAGGGDGEQGEPRGWGSQHSPPLPTGARGGQWAPSWPDERVVLGAGACRGEDLPPSIWLGAAEPSPQACSCRWG